MVPAEARPAGMGRFLRPLLSSAEVVVNTSMMSSVMPALACKQDMDSSDVSVGQVYLSVDRSTFPVDRSTLCANRFTVSVDRPTLSVSVPQGRGQVALYLYAWQKVKTCAAADCEYMPTVALHS